MCCCSLNGFGPERMRRFRCVVRVAATRTESSQENTGSRMCGCGYFDSHTHTHTCRAHTDTWPTSNSATLVRAARMIPATAKEREGQSERKRLIGKSPCVVHIDTQSTAQSVGVVVEMRFAAVSVRAICKACDRNGKWLGTADGFG